MVRDHWITITAEQFVYRGQLIEQLAMLTHKIRCLLRAQVMEMLVQAGGFYSP
ncbi:hypothetical protein D3C77_678920 [compost metagenome]